MDHAPNCYACGHFKATYDSAAPRSCGKFGFKCKEMPSLMVLATTGNQCIFFEEKSQRASFAPVMSFGGAIRDGSTFSALG